MSGINFPTSKSEFRLMSSAIDFCDLVYFTLPKNGIIQNGSGELNSSEKIKKTVSKLSFICSSERADSFANEIKALTCSTPKSAFERYLKSNISNLSNKPNLLSELFIVESEPDDFLESLIYQVSKKWNYKNAAVYSAAYSDDDFIGIFILLSDYQYEDLKLIVEAAWVAPYLDLLHFYYPRVSASLSQAIYSPSNIPSKTLAVLRLTAKGAKSKEIGEELCLTTRGVEYHLEKAKNFLNASNKVELIGAAKDSCLI